MTPLYWILGLIAAQRLAELVLAKRNTKRLLAAGGREIGAGHYPIMVALHTSWLAAMLIFIDAGAGVFVPALIAFLVFQAARVWVLWALGPYWTTRVITLDNAPLVRRGPYKFVRHPNYLIVVAEIALGPMIFYSWKLSLVFSILNGILLTYRIKVESAVLAARSDA